MVVGNAQSFLAQDVCLINSASDLLQSLQEDTVLMSLRNASSRIRRKALSITTKANLSATMISVRLRKK